MKRMGEAKRRKLEIERLKREDQEWVNNLTPAERTAAQVSQRAYTQIVERKGLVSGCYLLAFFLHEMLHSKYSIQTELIVGWINDGTWPGVGSHAWIELGGKKIDISLTLTEHRDAQPPGDLIVLDRVLRPGTTKYTYCREPTAEAAAFMEAVVRDGVVPSEVVEEKNREHAYVSRMAKTRDGILTYLNEAPPDRTFRVLERLVD
jgi:hypothetical protein